MPLVESRVMDKTLSMNTFNVEQSLGCNVLTIAGPSIKIQDAKGFSIENPDMASKHSIRSDLFRVRISPFFNRDGGND